MTVRFINSRYFCYTILLILITLSSAFLNTGGAWAQMISQSIKVGEAPQNMNYNPSNGNMYVANFNSGDISVIDSATNKVISTIQVGSSPNALEYNPSNGNMYVANSESGDISVIDSATNKVISTVETGDNLQNLVYNPSNGNIYVANENSNDVSLIITTKTNSTS